MRFAKLARIASTTTSSTFFHRQLLPRTVIMSPAPSASLSTTALAAAAPASQDKPQQQAVEPPQEYVPPKVWTWESKGDDNKFAAVNQPTAGARFQKDLPRGEHPLQLYSMATPNGQKVTIFLEELLQAGVATAEYDAWLISIMQQDQFGSGFVAANPNSKIPALLDYSSSSTSNDKDGAAAEPVRVFESGSILLYLADKYAGQHPFLPNEQRTEIMNWLFWQMGSAPYLGGGFGHFYTYAAVKQEYPINRFTMEAKRQLSVLENQLAKTQAYVTGPDYTIADMAIWPWYGELVLDEGYPGAATFLNVAEDYPHVIQWAKRIKARRAVQRGCIVNRVWGDSAARLAERHAAGDIDEALRAFEDATEKSQDESATTE